MESTDCSGLQAGYFVCIGVAGSTTTTTSNPHSPQQTGIAANCNKYYFVEIGDGCAAIASTYSITLADFYSWNPAVGTSCQSLQAGYYVCVGVSGSTTSTTTTKPTTTTKAPITTTTASGPSPTQSGITADCETFDQAVSGDSCWTIVSEKYTYLTQDQFYAWNPAVGPTCSNLQAGYYYCVATKTVHAMPNTISTCKKWHTWLPVETTVGLLNSSTALLRPSLGPGIHMLGPLVHLSGWVTMFASVFEDDHFIGWHVTSSLEGFLFNGVRGDLTCLSRLILPLSLAIRHGHEETFDILVKHKARACGEDECPVVAAVKYHRFHELRVLVRLGDCGHWDEALSLALDTRPIFDHMVDNGVEIKKYGHVALFGAITEGKKDWVEFLISQGADPNLCLSTESDIGGGEKKYSSIYHAILNGHLDVCKFLIEHGVQPEEDDLQLAREKEYDEIVGILSGFSYVDVPEKEDLITRWINTHS
ncbi:hypothetical protein KXV65_004749 [Aspergillus fumigatus]|nr:hypothetical protein KXX65_008121 [Aspergillus fumigatus]KAH2029135.1 hypothetical protein KXV65_004749 [Aspergillus fumigatus]KAH2313688.1 hypothetical protein KXW82_008693 [Aspergillus fumigatus]KAH2593941.1 hypothetical protein KXV63_006833 [Aspergillus fumigatus]KAH2869224.1 hypothetical protein KXV67_005040 [Aspergillus fumigatus]